MTPQDHLDPEQTLHLTPSDGPLFGERFRILRTLGAGAMGEVFLAEDVKLQRQVAIKCIRSEHQGSSVLLRRIKRECLLHARIGAHPHIVTLFDLIEWDGKLLIVMEYVEGEALDRVLRQSIESGGKLARRQCIEIALQCLEALSHTHRHGIIHRDIKPGNVILAAKGQGNLCAKLMDFGIARLEEDDPATATLTQPGARSPGTPLYMAPEQIDSSTYGDVTPSADLYAVGVMLYHMLAGRPPFLGTLTGIFNGHLNTPPKPIAQTAGDAIDGALWAVIERAMAKRPEERFSSAETFANALRPCLDGPERETRVRTSSFRKRRGFSVQWGAALAALLVTAGWVYVNRERPPQESSTPWPEINAPIEDTAEEEVLPAPANSDEPLPDVRTASLPEIDSSMDASARTPELPLKIVEATTIYPPVMLEGSEPREQARVEIDRSVANFTLSPADLEGATYVAGAGETLRAVAEEFGLDPEDLARWNGMEVTGALAEGQEIYLSDHPTSNPDDPASLEEKTPTGQVVKEQALDIYGKTKKGIRYIGKKVKGVGK